MARTVDMDKKEYLELRKQVQEDIEKYNVKKMTPSERTRLASERIKELKFENEEKEKFYVANLLIPDENEFFRVHQECGKSLNVCAERLEVPELFVIARIFEKNKYGKYLDLGDKDMESFVEIINDEEQVNNGHNVEEDTSIALAKINALFESNDSKAETIGRQVSTIDKLNEQIADLEAINADYKKENEEQRRQNQILEKENVDYSKENDEQKQQIDNLTTENADLKHKLSVSEQTVEEQRKEIKDLLLYKEAYDKLIERINAYEVKTGTTR